MKARITAKEIRIETARRCDGCRAELAAGTSAHRVLLLKKIEKIYCGPCVATVR